MPKLTNKCAICGKPILKSWTICDECREKQRCQEEEINIEIAKTRARLIPEVLWEKRRYETAKDVLAAFMANNEPDVHGGSPRKQAIAAVEYADALIEELRMEKK